MMAAALSLAVTGCWDDGDAMDATPSGDFLRTKDVVVPGDGTQAAIEVEANCQWSIATGDTWLSLGASSGEGNGSVQVTMTQNPSSAQERTATVTLKSAAGIATTLTVRQEVNSEQIKVTPTELEFLAADKGYQEFTVTANGHWTVTGRPEWVKLSASEGMGNGSIQVRVDENTQEDDRTPAVLTVTGDGGATATLTIRQLGRSSVLTASPQNMTVAATGEKKTLAITGNVGWMLSASDEWLTSFSTLSGTEPGEVTFSCLPNYATQPRTATITVMSENGRQTVTVTVTQQAGQLPQLGKLLLMDSNDQQATMACTVESMFEVTEFGICYGAEENPTTAGQKVVAGREAPAEGTFTATVSGLTKGSAYHARAYAVSDAGTAYSEDLSFVALPMPQNDDNERPLPSRRK